MNRLAALLAAILILGALGGPRALADAPSPGGAPDLAPSATQTILSETFEGTWPSAGWTITDLSNDGFDRKWGKDDFKPYDGSYSVWPAAAGAHKLDPANSPYPDNMNTRMVYGPFDLSDALTAELRFWLWEEIEVDFDYLYLGTSADNIIYNEEFVWEGSLDWSEIIIELTPYAGDGSVWVRWDFFSDESVVLAGPFIDNITITKDALAAPSVTISRSGSNIQLNWGAVTGATSYEVWRGTNSPYFAPGTDCAGTPASCSVVTTNSYTHTGGSGSAASNYTYLVKSVAGAVKSTLSNRVGEFDFTLTR